MRKWMNLLGIVGLLGLAGFHTLLSKAQMECVKATILNPRQECQFDRISETTDRLIKKSSPGNQGRIA
jgi:hypothetical protein